MHSHLATALAIGVLVMTHVAHADDDRAREDYLLHCMGCHAEDGRGLVGKVPSFPDELGRLLATAQGREFIQRVPGVSQSDLSSERLAAVLNWIVKTYVRVPVAADIVPFTAAEVDQLRSNPVLNVAEQRADL